MYFKKEYLIILSTFICSILYPTTQDLVHLSTALSDYDQYHNTVLFEQRKQALYQFYTAQYLSEVQKLCTTALTYLVNQPATEKSAVIFDIDDTALYTYQWHTPAAFIWSTQPHLVEARTHGRHKKAPAIPPVLDLYNALKARGFTIIFLSARPLQDLENTKNELHMAGYHHNDPIILMPENLPTPTHEDAYSLAYKTSAWKCSIRKHLTQQYTLVGCIGDRATDFEGGYTGYQVRLPNYLY